MCSNNKITILAEENNGSIGSSTEPPSSKKIRVTGPGLSSGPDSSIQDFPFPPPILPVPPRTLPIPPPSDIFNRLSTFLPQLHAANASLEQDILTGKIIERNIENVGEDEDQYIEMNLGLGVLEHKKPKKGRGRRAPPKQPIADLEPQDVIHQNSSDSDSSSYFSSSEEEEDSRSEGSSSEDDSSENKDDKDDRDSSRDSNEEEEAEEWELPKTKFPKSKPRPKLRAKSILAKLLNMQDGSATSTTESGMKKIIIEEIPDGTAS